MGGGKLAENGSGAGGGGGAGMAGEVVRMKYEENFRNKKFRSIKTCQRCVVLWVSVICNDTNVPEPSSSFFFSSYLSSSGKI